MGGAGHGGAPFDRGLTPGERALLDAVFGHGIAAHRVCVHARKWWAWQGPGFGMAPDGHLWLHPLSPLWRQDYAHERPGGLFGFFVHEMAHVWQHRQGVALVRRRPPLARYRWWPDAPRRPFSRLGIEQQAELVADGVMAALGRARPGLPPPGEIVALVPFLDAAAVRGWAAAWAPWWLVRSEARGPPA